LSLFAVNLAAAKGHFGMVQPTELATSLNGLARKKVQTKKGNLRNRHLKHLLSESSMASTLKVLAHRSSIARDICMTEENERLSIDLPTAFFSHRIEPFAFVRRNSTALALRLNVLGLDQVDQKVSHNAVEFAEVTQL
jgi:hypothetical protein